MSSCARIPHPHAPFKPVSVSPPNPSFTSPHGPAPLRCALVARAAPRDGAPLSTFDFLALKRELEEEQEKGAVAAVDAKEGEGGDGFASEDDVEEVKRSGSSSRRRARRQMVRRSGLLAKQVISVSSAQSLGFVSQLWVDAASWAVAMVEVRPSLLSGEAEKFLFNDIYQVGDVVLVEDESVVENELKLFGLHSLVGYDVVTSRQRNVGKVRGFTFDINSGAMESLELDSFGLSILPASLVSTYCLFVEDVLDIVSETIVVHEDAVSRVQRLTQGIWGTQNIQGRVDQRGEYSRYGRRRAQPVGRQNSPGKSMGRKLHRKTRNRDDEWELPLDY